MFYQWWVEERYSLYHREIYNLLDNDDAKLLRPIVDDKRFECMPQAILM